MSFENVIATLSRWQVTTEAFAALGAELQVGNAGETAPVEIVRALRAVSEAAGLGDIEELNPQQRAMVLALVRQSFRQAADLIDDPGRAPGWAYTDATILDGWGRGSMMVPGMIAASLPELGDVRAVLDVGTGVGLLAVAAAGLWPNATIVGLDVWEPSLERARIHVTEAGLADRIELRKQSVTDLDDVDRFDLSWVPTFFLDESALAGAIAPVVRATKPNGWVVLGRFDPPPDPLAEATARLRTIRAGGSDIDTKRALELLESAGCENVHSAPRPGPSPLELLVGRKPQS